MKKANIERKNRVKRCIKYKQRQIELYQENIDDFLIKITDEKVRIKELKALFIKLSK